MIVWIKGHPFHYEIENLCRIFFPYEKIETRENVPSEAENSLWAAAVREVRSDGTHLYAAFCRDGKKTDAQETVHELTMMTGEKELERRMAVLLYGLLTTACGYTPKWGILTGVRPIKLLRRLTDESGEDAACAYFQEKLLVSPEKTELSLATMANEQRILSLSREDSFSLYLSIPFCPTRCSYCSFVSTTVERAAKLIPDYVRLLCEEARDTARLAKELGLKLESAYIGGGTPTTLNAEQLAVLLDTVRESFDFSCCKEFTVEAGRPDTITAEKLDVLNAHGVTRISINPQTLRDEVLQTIGRRHTAAQALAAFELARVHGCRDINMDLIAGLPGDTAEGFRQTLDRITDLSPESITIHTLALKRSAQIYQQEEGPFEGEAAVAGEMLRYAQKKLTAGGWIPYYLYRQSRMVGNLENTGWAKPGHESLYNVYIMDETHTILACGAGAVTKVRDPHSDRLERVFNFKYPYEYIGRYEEIRSRKDQVRAIYEKYR